MQPPQPSRSRARQTYDEQRRGERRPTPIRANRLLFGVALVVVGLVWSILNATVWSSTGTARPAPVIVHGPVSTRVQTVHGLRVRPQPVMSDPSASATVRLSFRNDATIARAVSPRDVRLLVHGRAFAARSVAPYPLPATTLKPGRFVTGTVDFSVALNPGATLVYAPPWAEGQTLRWVLYR